MRDREDRSRHTQEPRPEADSDRSLPRPCGRMYRITVRGQLGNDWSDWFDGLQMATSARGETVLSGTIVDQAALMGVLNKLNRLNVTLLSLSQVGKEKQG